MGPLWCTDMVGLPNPSILQCFMHRVVGWLDTTVHPEPEHLMPCPFPNAESETSGMTATGVAYNISRSPQLTAPKGGIRLTSSAYERGYCSCKSRCSNRTGRAVVVIASWYLAGRIPGPGKNPGQ
jgi:hypothetical protein